MPSWELIHKATVFIAEEMGVALKRSALSPNIRERVDLSCAVADGEGRIVAQAEHIPVHLGSFRVCVRNVLEWLRGSGVELEEGDALVLNDPYISGTHLNDVTVVAPVVSGGEVVAYVACKAHYVDVGGPAPGSINPAARTLYEEGFIVPPVKLVRRGSIDRDLLEMIAANSKTPRIVACDLRAQAAVVQLGVKRVLELMGRYGSSRVLEAWSESIEYARALAAKRISGWRGGVYEAEDFVELGEEDLAIRARVEIRGGGVSVDFTGTSSQVEAPLNAVFGVTYAAVSFAVRAVMGGEIPTNEGFYSLVEVYAPEGSLLNPRKPAPVSGGNLETSQRVADVVLRALAEAVPERVPAAGSGTMMNVMLGGVSEGGYWAYYETVGGGTGARPCRDGVSGVHVNMTNTLNTPIEVAERSYPILYTAYRIREGSGGRGRYRGGDGIVRSFIALKPCRLSILADRFRRGPYGLQGGEPGAPGRVTIKKRDGRVLEMPSKFTTDLEAGDEVIVETPGGGGWGVPEGSEIQHK
ncbi:MAG: hydantoinase B/oxoprolinase family protein [Thermofilaceae archaeon]